MFRGDDLSSARARHDAFDPIAAGAHYRLSSEVSAEIWQQLCRAADAVDDERLRQQFHALATQVAARGGRFRPEVGKTTGLASPTPASRSSWLRPEVGKTTSLDSPIPASRARSLAEELGPRTPGRTTHVLDELVDPPFGPPFGPPLGAEGSSPAIRPYGPPGARDVAEALASLANPQIAPARPRTTAPDPMRRRFGIGLAGLLGHRTAATLYRRAVTGALVDLRDPAVGSALHQRGGGLPLSEELRRPVERELGVSLAGVRIHTGAVAAQAAHALGAEAFTIGQDIFFADARFAPETAAGQQLLAHELTHAAQMLRGATAAAGDDIQVSDPDDALEREAHAVAEHIASRDAVRSAPAPGRAGDAGPTAAAPAGDGVSYRVPDAGPTAAPADNGVIYRAPAAAAAAPAVIAEREADPRGLDPETQDAMSRRDPRLLAARRDPALGNSTEVEVRAPGARTRSPAAAGTVPAPPRAPAARRTVPTPDPAATIAQARESAPTTGMGNAIAATPIQTRPAPPALPAQQLGGVTPYVPPQIKPAAVPVTDEFGFAPPEVDKLIPPRTPYDTRQDRADAETIAINEYNSDRTHATGQLRTFQSHTNHEIASLGTVVPQIDATLTAAETSALTQVHTAAGTARSHVASSFSHAIDHTRAAGETLRQTIETQSLLCSFAVLMATLQANQRAVAAHQAAMAVVDAAESAQLAQLDSLYEQAKAKIRMAGIEAALLATSIGEQRAAEFQSHKINREDNIWKGHLTDKRCDAQAKAARGVAKSFADEVVKSGNEQADKLDAQKPGDQAAIQNLANGVRDQLDKALCVTLCNVDKSSKDALDGLQKSRTTLLTQVQTTEHDAITALEHGRDSARSAIDQLARDLEAGIRTERAATAAGLHARVQHATDELQTSQATFLASMRGKPVPEPGAIDAAVAATGTQIATQLAAQRQAVLAAAASSAQSLHQTAATGQRNLDETGTSAAASATEGASEIASGFTTFGAQVTTSLTKFATTYAKGIADFTTQAVTSIQQIGDAIHPQYDQNTQDLQKGFDQTYAAVRSALMKSVDGVDRSAPAEAPPPAPPRGPEQPAEAECCPEHHTDPRPEITEPQVADDSQGAQGDSKTINPTIDEEAEKARKAVQPRWKAVLMWVITAIVTIVVAVVLGPMVIGAIAGFAGAFMAAGLATAVATVVGGAILGAATSFVLTLVDNGINGRPAMEGMGMAVLMGVIGGAAGGGLGAIMDKAIGAVVTKVAGSLLKNAGKLAPKLLHGTLDIVSELGQDVAGNAMGAAIEGKITGQPGGYQWSWSDFGQSVIGMGAGKGPRKIRIDEKISAHFHAAGTGAGVKLGGKAPGDAGGGGDSHPPAALPPPASAPAVPKQDLPRPNASPPPTKLSGAASPGKSAAPHGKPGAGAGPAAHAKPDASKSSGGAAGPSPTPGAGSKGSQASGDAAHGPGATAGAAPAVGAPGTPHAGGGSVPGAAAAHGGSSSHVGGAAPAGHGDAGHAAASAGQDTVKTKAAVDWGVVQSVNVTGQPTAGAKHSADAELGRDFHQGVSELGTVLGHELHPAIDQVAAKTPKLESSAAAQLGAMNQLPKRRLPRPHGEAEAPAMAHSRLTSALGELHAATAAAKTAHDGPSRQAALENSISAYLKLKSATDLVHIVTRDEQAIIHDPSTPVGIDGSPALTFATHGDPLVTAATWLKPVSGKLDVVVHGSSDKFLVRKDGKMVELDVDHIVEVIKAHGGADQAIRLISCNTGSHDMSIAQVLADKLGVKVEAPSDTVWITPDGRVVIGKNPFEATGSWSSYAPKQPRQVDVAPSDLPKPGDTLAGNVAASDGGPKRPRQAGDAPEAVAAGQDMSDPVAAATLDSPPRGVRPTSALVINPAGTGLHKFKAPKNDGEGVNVRSGGLLGTGTKTKIPSGELITVNGSKPASDQSYIHATYNGQEGYVKTGSLDQGTSISESSPYFLMPASENSYTVTNLNTGHEFPAQVGNAAKDELVSSLQEIEKATTTIGNMDGIVKMLIRQISMGAPPDPKQWELAITNLDEVVATRVDADIPKLVTAGLITDKHTLKNVEFSGADFHKQGQAPVFLNFETADATNPNPIRVVYKPANLGLDGQLFGSQPGSMAHALDDSGDTVSRYKIVPTQDGGGDYSYMEFVHSDTPKTSEDLLNVYGSLGASMAMSHLVGLQDIHQENVLLLRDRIQVIDMEATTGQFSKKTTDDGELDPNVGGFNAMLWPNAITVGLKAKLDAAVRNNTLTDLPDTAAATERLTSEFDRVLKTAAAESFDAAWDKQTAALAAQSSRVVPIATASFYDLIPLAKNRDKATWDTAVDNNDNGIVDSARGQTGADPAFIARVLKSPGTYNALQRGEVPYYSRGLGKSDRQMIDEEGNLIDATGSAAVGDAIDTQMNGRRAELADGGDQADVYAMFKAQMVPAVASLNDGLHALVVKKPQQPAVPPASPTATGDKPTAPPTVDSAKPP